jgi:hypothetical protein
MTTSTTSTTTTTTTLPKAPARRPARQFRAPQPVETVGSRSVAPTSTCSATRRVPGGQVAI